ncbi:hypothetical protein BJX61DRAFT_317305 [Aspergillus egyptiacus]|nr:hypothetical protein BJX61DRAFT_317305 [Aspergillus egyptiacus]
MPVKMRLNTGLVASLAAFSGVADAFWRLPCRGRSGLARMDPLVNPGEPSYHVHTVHGSSGFGLTADMASLLGGDCTSCAVKQDKSAYWAPAMYFIDGESGDAELVDEVGGLLAYYLLYGEGVQAFPDDFRMIAGDPFLRNFSWPVPDPPKSEWTGDQASQAALAQKALGFNCLNYEKDPEPSLGRHFLPDKAFLDANCKDGIRIELMFPSCWNGKDVDSDDHKSHVAYPSLVMDGTCPEGFEHRIVSLFFETIWDTYAFKDRDGYFALSTGDPTGFGYHGDFMHGWEPGVLEEAVKTCTNPSGRVEDCPVFDLQSDFLQSFCTFDVPDDLDSEELEKIEGGLPNKLAIEWGPEYAFPIKYVDGSQPSSTPKPQTHDPEILPSVSIDLGALAGNVHAVETSSTTPPPPPPTTTSTSTSTWTPTPTTSYVQSTVTQEIVWVEQEIIVFVNEDNVPVKTETGEVDVLSTVYNTVTRTVSTVVQVPTAPAEQPVKRHHDHLEAHKRHNHGHHAH